MYQCMWLAHSNMNFFIFDDIQGGRFKRYIQHRKIQYGIETVIDIHIDNDDKLSCGTSACSLSLLPSIRFCFWSAKIRLIWE